MTDREAGEYWEQNADAWTFLASRGCDVYRDLVNTPAFLDLLPDVRGLKGLDIGCGEGYNTRLVAARGAEMWGVDISPTFIRHAQAVGNSIRYVVTSGQRLPFAANTFDFATAFMSLMDMPQPEAALQEAARVMKPSGFLQFSMMHPCFFTPHRKLLRNAQGREYAVEVGGYFHGQEERFEEWLFSAAPCELKAGLRPFRVPIFHRTLSDWMNTTVDAGLRIARLAGPRASDDTAELFPSVADTRVVAYFLHVRCRKS